MPPTVTAFERLLYLSGHNTVSVAKELGANPATVFHWTKGRCMPHAKHIPPLANLLQCSRADLVTTLESGLKPK